MKYLFALFLLVLSCTNVTEVESTGVARLPVVNNVEILLDFDGLGGKSVHVTNANARTVGVDIRRSDKRSTIIYSDSWIGPRNAESISGVNFEHGWPLVVTVVVYKDLGGSVAGFIQSLGSDFLDDVQDFNIESKEEINVTISKG